LRFSELFADLLSRFVNAPYQLQKSYLEVSPECNFLVSYIKPILKGSDTNPTEAGAYRPISVSHTISVIIERTLGYSHFRTSTPHNFFGYIKGRSCDIAIETLKKIVAADKRMQVGHLKASIGTSYFQGWHEKIIRTSFELSGYCTCTTDMKFGGKSLSQLMFSVQLLAQNKEGF